MGDERDAVAGRAVGLRATPPWPLMSMTSVTSVNMGLAPEVWQLTPSRAFTADMTTASPRRMDCLVNICCWEGEHCSRRFLFSH